MTTPLNVISSMATRQLLAELATLHEQRCGTAVRVESVGGVDAAKRVEAGEAFDVVVLASDAIDKLQAGGRVRAGSKVDLVRSGVSVAVPAGRPLPDIGSEDALRRAVLAAPGVGYSTGPSGVHLLRLFDRWGITEQIKPRLMQAPPGVPVGALVARGEVALGLQQLSELLHVPGITIVGPLPHEVQITTIFSAAMCAAATQPDAARDWLDFMASPDAADVKRRQGMDPA